MCYIALQRLRYHIQLDFESDVKNSCFLAISFSWNMTISKRYHNHYFTVLYAVYLGF